MDRGVNMISENFASRVWRRFTKTLLAVFLVVTAAPASVMAAGPAQQDGLAVVSILIKGREFHPSTVKLPLGSEVVLMFHNQDVELHAFVPNKFLEDVPLEVDGNGAPQFGDSGLQRILIPSGGRAGIRFRPMRPGQYEYRCDLPGHQMVAHVVVE